MTIGTKSIKLAGPDRDGNFKVLQVKNTARLLPGDVLDEGFVFTVVMDLRETEGIDVIAVEYRDDAQEMRKFGIESDTTSFKDQGVGCEVRTRLRGD